jgi:Putative abortive phage resistance protein AbiGi, antitoxin
MPLSINAVIHYTDTYEKLKGIISDKFKIKYCLEGVIGQQAAFPLVSFCDIPLSQIKYHTENYGQYGIGLTREWANSNNLNPVVYVNENSHFDNAIKKQGDKLNQVMHSQSPGDWEGLELYTSVLSFVKSFKGLVTRDSKPFEVIFYNEREWRYVPSKEEIKRIGASFQVWGPNYTPRKDFFNNTLKDLRLPFGIEDISHIIVKDGSEISDLISHLKATFRDEGQQRLEILFTKISTMRQINEEF